MKIAIHLFNQTDFENFENKTILQNLGFEPKYGQTCFLSESFTLFVGLEMKKVKTFDPFYKVDFFHLGAKIAESLAKMKIDEIKIDYISGFSVSEFPKPSSNFESEKAKKLSKNLLDLQLGINQKMWKFDKYKTNLKNEKLETEKTKTPIKITLTTNLQKQFSQFDSLKLESLNLGMSLNRFVVEETPENFNPKTAVEIVQKELGNYENVEIKVRDYNWLLENGFGGVCAVGRASENKPNLVHAKITLGNKIQNSNSQDISQNSFQIEDKNIIIRKAKQEDLMEIFEIRKNGVIQISTSNELGTTKDDVLTGGFERLINNFELPNYQFWVLEKDDQIVGFSQILYHENYVKLDKFYISEEFQNQNLGSHLLAHTLTNMINKDQKIKVEVVEFNQKAIGFYEKFGFKKSETKIKPFIQPSGKEIPAIEMVLESGKLAEIQHKINKNELGNLKNENITNKSENSKNLRQTDKVLTFGTPNYDLKNPRENVRGVLFDPITQKYCLIQMENLPFFLVGGGTDGKELKTALAREIREELGYTDFEIKAKLGKEILIYNYAKNNSGHKLCSETGFLVILNSQNEQTLELSETEKQKKLTKTWKTSDEIQQIWQNDKLNNPQLESFWEIFQRGVSKAIQLGLDKVSSPEIFDKEFITRIVLIGKGLTYDTGGLDIKTDGHMKEMKTDMGGSGLMLGVMKTLAEMSNSGLIGKNVKSKLANSQKIQKSLEILKNLNQGNLENMIFGKARDNELENPRINVRAVIFDPKSEKFSFVKMMGLPLLAGGGTDGEYLQTALRREIQEELGYTNFEIVGKLGKPVISYITSDKPTHCYLSDTGFLVILNSLEKTETNLSEEEKESNLREVWLTVDEILDIWHDNLISENPDLGYARHLEIFRRGLEKIEENENKSNLIKKDWNLENLQIETERLILKPISLDFTQEIFEEFTTEITEFLFVQPTGKIGDKIKFIEDSIQKNKEKIDLTCLILNKNNEFLGLVGLHHLDDKPSFGIWLKKLAQGQDLGKETIKNLSNWAFENLNLPYITYEIFEKNSQSQKLIDSIGGQFVKKYTKTKNQITTEILEYQIPNPNYQDFKLSNQTENAKNLNSELKTLENILKGEILEIHWLTAFCENSVNSDSYRSDDILTSFSGQTVEVWNTDAEGRLTLADVLSYSTLLEPDYIVDAATLTGACVVANSCYFTGLMGNDEILNQSLLTSFVDNNEHTVQNHFPEMLRESVLGDLGDLVNTGKLQRQAGHITAGLFLSHFIDQNNWRPQILDKYRIKNPRNYAWTHLDIAGTSFNKKQNSLQTDGATGQSVRSLVDWILSLG